jgi:hypothetical protein
MSGAAASVYVTDNFSEPMTAQHNFVNNFDLDHPEDAMSAYQRYVFLTTGFYLCLASNDYQDYARTHQAPAQHCYQLCTPTNWHDTSD